MNFIYKAWGVFKNGKIRIYDNIPLIYTSKNRAKEECSIFARDNEEVRKIKVIIEEFR